MFFAIPNLASQSARQIENPWSEPLAPQKMLDADKSEFSVWCTTPTTKHCFFSAAEGLDPLRRVSGENNRVVALHGFIADIDREIPDQHFTAEYIHKKCKSEYLPNYASRTHSGNGRLVWLFSRPVAVPNQEAASAFYKYLARELKASKIWGALDPKSWAPEQYYERGRDWTSVSNDPIPEEMLIYWLFESGKEIQFTNDERDLRLPWDKVNDRFHELHPGKWPGVLEEGARGPAFWRDTRSGNSAIVRKGGIQDFGGDFRTWSSLLGHEWVAKAQGERIGQTLKSFWTDEKIYYNFDPDDSKAPVLALTLGKLERKLRVEYNFSEQKMKGRSYSELDEVIKKIDERVVAGAAPFIHFPSAPLLINGKVYLNTSRVRPLAPAPEPEEYKGQPIPFGYNFPYTAEILKHIFAKDSKGRYPLEYFLAAIRYKYAHALAYDPRPSQAIGLMGERESGKSFLTEGLIAPVFGDPRMHASAIALEGRQIIHQSIVGRPFEFAVGRTGHNDDLQEFPVWTYDDEYVRNLVELDAYTNFIKKTTATGSVRFNPKHMKALNVIWRGVQTICSNLDGMSSRQLPNMDGSTLDKIHLFRIRGGFPFLPREEGFRKVREELPHFCRWLLNWRVPPHCVGTPRFEINTYHDPRLLQMAYENGANFEFSELLSLFLHNFREQKKANGETVTEWVGTSSQLFVELNTWNGPAVRSYTANSIGRSLKDLVNKGLNIRVRRDRKNRLYYIPVEIHLMGENDEGFDDPIIVPATDEDIKQLTSY